MELGGEQDSASLSGSDGTVIATGDTAFMRLHGTDNAAIVCSDNSSVVDDGTDNDIFLAGVGDVARLMGSDGRLEVTGDGAFINLMGTHSTAIVRGDGGTLLDFGSGNRIDLRGDNESLVAAGSDACITSTGHGNTISVSGTGNAIDASGASISVGDGTSAALHGEHNTIAMGADATLELTGFRNEVIDASSADDADVLALGGWFDHDQLWFANANGDLVISVLGRHRDHSVTVSDWFDSPDSHISTIKTGDGFSISDEGVDQLVQAMAAFSPPAQGHSHLSHTVADALEPVLAANWQHS
jgi:hypothetical protein